MLWLGLEWMVPCLIWDSCLQVWMQMSGVKNVKQDWIRSFVHSSIHSFICILFLQPECAGAVGGIGTLLFCPLAGLSGQRVSY